MSFWIGASIENLLFYGFDIHTGWGEDTDITVDDSYSVTVTIFNQINIPLRALTL